MQRLELPAAPALWELCDPQCSGLFADAADGEAVGARLRVEAAAGEHRACAASAGGAAYDAPVGSAPTMEQEQFSSNAMAEWRAEQARLIAEKDAAEQRELQVIREEAQAERELMYSQREKQLDAAFKTNRERQESVVQDMELKGWEAVVNLSSDSNLVPGSTADLAKYKALLTRLKHKEPEAFSAAV